MLVRVKEKEVNNAGTIFGSCRNQKILLDKFFIERHQCNLLYQAV